MSQPPPTRTMTWFLITRTKMRTLFSPILYLPSAIFSTGKVSSQLHCWTTSFTWDKKTKVEWRQLRTAEETCNTLSNVYLYSQRQFSTLMLFFAVHLSTAHFATGMCLTDQNNFSNQQKNVFHKKFATLFFNIKT